MFAYVVCCEFDQGSEGIADRWLHWLTSTHLSDVLQAGAVSAEVILIDGATRRYEIHYRFASRVEYETYLQQHAPRLRQEGLALFPLELGLSYARRCGEVVGRLPD